MPKTSLASLQKKIESLQKEAERIRGTEVAAVIERIKTAIRQYGLTPEDIFEGGGRRRGAKRAAARKVVGKRARASAGRKVAIKYRDSGGNTWTGRGSQPRWLVAALKEGKKIED